MLANRIHTVDPMLLGGVSKGQVFDLCSGWWPGMPVAPAHPPFHVSTYRTPRGMRAEQQFAFASGTNDVEQGFISEIISTTAHIGTHIDALCHVTSGRSDTWHGGYSANDYLGDAGALREDASHLPPIIARGVLLDIPRALGEHELPDGFPIGPQELVQAAAAQSVTFRDGDVVLVRTGMMREWPDPVRMNRTGQPGLSLDGARWLQAHSPSIVGADNTSVEVAPSGHDGDPQPVHRFLLHDHGVLLLEWVYLEGLADAEIHEFLFIAAPLPIAGATGSLIRPLAVA